MSLLDTLRSALDSDTVTKLAAKIGVDPEQAKATLMSALPAFVGAFAKNSAQPEGAQALHKALDDHQGDAKAKLDSPNLLAEGQKILGHLFGGQGDNAAAAVAKVQGSPLSLDKIKELLAGAAPMVMGALGKKKQADGVDAAGLAQGLQADGEQAKSEAGGLLDFLGSAGGEGGLAGLAEKGKSLLGGLLG